MALWRLKGEVVFGTVQGRTTFLANHDIWRLAHTLLVDVALSMNSENGVSTGNLVRLDVATDPEQDTEDYFDALRALPTLPFTRAFLSLHRCVALDQIGGPNTPSYYEFHA